MRSSQPTEGAEESTAWRPLGAPSGLGIPAKPVWRPVAFTGPIGRSFLESGICRQANRPGKTATPGLQGTGV